MKRCFGQLREVFVSLDVLLQHATSVVFDVETTGFGRESRIVEIAAVRLEGWQPAEEWQTLVHPEMSIPPMASRVHHIDDRMVEKAPKFAEVSHGFLHLLRDAVLVGHNIFTFDLHVLQRHFRDVLGMAPRLIAIDTLPLARKFFRLDSHKLTSLAEHLGIPLIAHHAMSDVYATAELWLHMSQKLMQKGCKSVGDVEHFGALRVIEGPMIPRFEQRPQATLLPRK
ncbi:MAG: 3'-5' exonuclease [Myxococcales bacterium]|nr:3'-5' exonuclease [Myxococcales bacterium]